MAQQYIESMKVDRHNCFLVSYSIEVSLMLSCMLGRKLLKFKTNKKKKKCCFPLSNDIQQCYKTITSLASQQEISSKLRKETVLNQKMT